MLDRGDRRAGNLRRVVPTAEPDGFPGEGKPLEIGGLRRREGTSLKLEAPARRRRKPRQIGRFDGAEIPLGRHVQPNRSDHRLGPQFRKPFGSQSLVHVVDAMFGGVVGKVVEEMADVVEQRRHDECRPGTLAFGKEARLGGVLPLGHRFAAVQGFAALGEQGADRVETGFVIHGESSPGALIESARGTLANAPLQCRPTEGGRQSVSDRRWIDHRRASEAVAMGAAFVVYFSVYGFRKPFTAARFADVGALGLGYKEIVVLAQVSGYTISKFLGIRVIAEMRPERRAGALVALVALAEAGLVLLGVLPRPWAAVGPFLNGLCLGMTFGLVFGFLEGRRSTEALAAGLCTSFIVADGVMKTVGAWILEHGISEDWMPAAAGALFTIPFALATAVLARTPAPAPEDEAARSARASLGAAERRDLYRDWALGLNLVVAVYVMVTVLRSVRADFAPQLWAGLGVDVAPRLYTLSELWVALVVTVVNGLAVFFVGNRRAFLASLGVCLAGAVLLAAALLGRAGGVFGPLVFMVLVGTATYLPLVAIHTTVFERFLAATGARGNAGYLLYVADSAGYLGYVAVLCLRLVGPEGAGSLRFFTGLCWAVAAGVAACSGFAWLHFASRLSTTDAVAKGRR